MEAIEISSAGPRSKTRCLHEMVEEQVERSPNTTAVIFEDKQLTYRQLNERSNQLARYLQGLGVGPDTLVGICVERSLEMMVGLLAILKAGGAYVPLDPAYPKERLAFMLADAGCPVVLTNSSLQGSIPVHSGTNIRVDAEWPGIAEGSVGNVASPVRAEHLAYMIYTSGSTGRPKGVVMEHRSLGNLICWQLQTYPFLAGERTLQFTSLSFDVSFQEIFSTWCAGGTLVLVTEELRRDPEALLRYLDEQQIERLFLPFVALQQLANAFAALQLAPAELRHVFTAGEQLRITEAVSTFFQKLADCTLHNHYGPTESHVATAFTLTGPPNTWPTLPPIGRPIANMQIHIMDRHLHLVPIGVPGELHIGGIGLARGYHNRPELTAEKFIPNPFRSEPRARLYKTGDLARYLTNGTIEYLGRMDFQVKIRGFRIELGEIESVLTGLPGIREAVVTAREDVPGDKQLVAYLTVKQGEPPKHTELCGLLREKLPEYMVPSAFVTLDRFPLTPNGKVDRKALPAPEEKNFEIEQNHVEPTTQSERALCRIWQKWLKLPQVGTRDNFFDLGGNSLLAIRVIGDINKALNVDLRVPVFFQNQTIEQLARVLEPRHPVRAKQSQLVPLRSGRCGPSVYFIGCGPTEMQVAQLISENRAVFGTDIQMPAEWMRALRSMDEANVPTLSQISALYADLVHAHAGSSPCVIVGYSFFGKVAFEAARALQRAGGNVAYVILIDAFFWTHTPPGWRQSLRWIWRGSTIERGNDITYLNKSAKRLRHSWRLLRWLIGRILPKVNRRGMMLFSSASGHFDDEGQSIEVADLYRFTRLIRKPSDPRPLEAHGLLLRAEFPGEKILPGHDFTNGWGGLFAKGLEIVHMDGSHFNIVRDKRGVDAIGRQINAVLDRYGLSNDEVALATGHNSR